MNATFEKASEIRARYHELAEHVVLGYRQVFDDILVAILARGHILLEGVPGIAKTTLAKTAARILGLDFKRVQLTVDVLPADITGHTYFSQKDGEFRFRQGPVFTNLLLADELNRATPKTQSALLEAMEEHQVTVEGTTHGLPDPFMVIATMNPVEFEGVYNLPEAQLDRFLFRTEMGYIEPEKELELYGRFARDGHQVRVAGSVSLDPLLDAARRVHVEPVLLSYVHDIVRMTRSHPELSLGASPRAAEHLIRGVRAWAACEGRTFALPDDVRALAPRTLAHRLILDVDSELGGATAAKVLSDILAKVPVPRMPQEASRGSDVAR